MKRKNRLTRLAPLALLNGCDKTPEAPAQIAPKTWNLPVMTAPVGAPVEYVTVSVRWCTPSASKSPRG